MALLNSFILGVAVAVITMLIVISLSYTYARLDFRHKNKLLMAVLLSVALPPISTLIPFFILFVQLNLSGTLTD